MPFIIDPNVLYLVLLLGLWLGVTAAYVPGTGVLELISIGLMLFGIWSLTGLAVNWWALILLILGVVGFLVMPFAYHRATALAILGLTLQTIGSLFLLPESPVSPVLIAATILLALLYHQFALRPILLRNRAKPITDEDEGLIGAHGRVLTAPAPVGSVYVRGETWSARSDRPLDTGDEVVVLDREGLTLHVEGLKHKREAESSVEEL